MLTNRDIARLLRAVAAAYQVKKEDQFKVIAYQRAADSIEHATSELKDLWEDGKLDEVPGIGEGIASHLDELFKTGQVKHFQAITRGLPEAMFELLAIPGIGAKTAYRLSKELRLKNPKTAIPDLKKEALAGKIREIEGFGEESEQDILRGIEEYQSRSKRFLLSEATEAAEHLIRWLRQSEDVVRADSLGSLRRKVTTIGDIDIAVATDEPERVIKHFTSYPRKARVLEAGKFTATILADSGYQIDLMVQPISSYGALLQHFTGSKSHNIALREYALKKGLSLSEYGIKKGKKLTEYQTEEDFYKALGMVWIPPEIRENTGEIEASIREFRHEKPCLPKLVELKDLKGDLHLHSDFPIETSHDEGASPMEKILAKAADLNYEYVAFSEHNPSRSRHNPKQIIEILKRKKEAVEVINYSHEKKKKNGVNKVFVHAFNSLEIDIKPDGRLPMPENGWDLLDFATVSVHSSFRMNREEMTKRVLDALAHPKVRILGHPTGRKLMQREGFELNWEKIFDFCLKNNKWLEINSWPERLDLPDNLVYEAVKRGVKMVINTDSHDVSQMELIRFGVDVARRGWAEEKDIVNTLEYNEFIGILKK